MPPEKQPEWNRFTDDDVSLLVMPSFHIGGTGYGIQTLAAGATGLIMQEFRAGDVLDLIEHEQLSKIFIVPSALQMLVQHPRAREVDYSRIRTILYGASPIPLSLLREAIEVFGCGFVQMYGMTETCGTICALPPDDHAVAGNQRMLSAGAPLSGVELRILDEAGKALATNAVGEIAVRSPLVMKGYWNHPDETAEVLSADGWFRTGDAGYIDADGYLFLKDRVKDMIVTGGENVYPAEVEAVLAEHPAIAEVAVIGVPSVKWGEEVKAVVALRAGSQAITSAELIAWARENLAGYKLPKSVDFIPELPRGATGKILRRELRAPYWEGSDRQIA
jgi:acyl-CoA synthetase (AMP-forming)/AMP-acid ligase II